MNSEDELFTLRQQFFTGEFEKVAQISQSDYFEEAQDIAKEYKLRSLLLLGEFKQVDQILSREPKSALNSTIEAYSQLLQGKDVSAQFDSLISEHQDQWYVQILGSFYLLKHGRVEDAIRLLQRHENSLECVLLLVQVFLSQGKLELAEKEVTNASSYAQDSIIFNFAEAYVNAAKNGESLRGSLYFFEELSHSHPTLKTLLGDLVLNLQLKQFQEADEVLRKINELGISSADLVANEYSYAQITGDSQLAKAKLDELTFLDAEHPVVVDYKEKEALFDSIVHKYKEQVN